MQPNAQDKANRSKFTCPKAILAPSPSGRCSSSVSSPREVPEGYMIGMPHTHRRIVPYRRREVQHTVTANRRDLCVSSIAAMRRESKREAVMIRRRYLPRHPVSTPKHTPPESPVHKTGMLFSSVQPFRVPPLKPRGRIRLLSPPHKRSHLNPTPQLPDTVPALPGSALAKQRTC